MRGRRPARVGIVADDFTGAADAASSFARLGLVTVACWSDSELTDRLLDADVIAVDARTRRCEPDEAARLTAAVVEIFRLGGVRTVLKKIDSLLRGRVADEVAAARAAWHPEALVIIAPAFPAMGRTTIAGRQCVHGAALDPPIAAMLEQSGMRASSCGLARVRATSLDAEFAESSGVDAMICDAESDDDLQRVVEAGLSIGRPVLWVGTAGLAAALARRVASGVPAGLQRIPWPVRTTGLVLTVVGSRSAMGRAQVAELSAGGVPCVCVPVSALFSEDNPDRDALVRQTSALVAAASDFVVTIDGDEATIENSRVVDALARLLALPLSCAGGLVLTGGETSEAMLRAAGVAALHVIDEIEPGAPQSIAVGSRAIPIVTKAGAFGHAGTLMHALARLKRPIVAITMGDPAGIGPEIIMKALAHPEVAEQMRPVVIGDARRLERAAALVNSSSVVQRIETPAQAHARAGTVDCIDLGLVPDDLPFGALSPIAGEAAYRCIERAVELASRGEVAAMCTAPINKAALQAAGHRFPGHTEILAALTGTPEVSMMLSAPNLRVIHCTTHVGLLDAIARIDPGLVERTIRRGHEALIRAGVSHPRIAVCGINPHAGEGGLFGRGEEERQIAPGVEAAHREGIDVTGPLPADTLFYRAVRGDFDLVVAMYHDQGHCPVKVLGLDAGVNITIGLPVIRTSVDHGTAFDIAGTGRADERSLLEALRQAAALAASAGVTQSDKARAADATASRSPRRHS